MPDQNSESEAEDNRPCLFRYITAITRCWGLLTVLVLWVMTVQAFAEKNPHSSYTKWYLVGITPLVTILEVLWIVNKCACCEYDQGCCCRTWHAILWIDGWKKTIVYILLSVPCFLKGIVAMWAVIYGLFLIVLAFFYLIKSIKYSSCIENKRNRPEEGPKAVLVSNEIASGSTNYNSTGTRPSRNQDWPPPGYAEGPDGSLFKVSTKNDEGNTAATHTKTFKSEGKNTRQTINEDHGFEHEQSSEWPPPGFATAADGSIVEVTNDAYGAQGRKNPFNKVQTDDRDDRFGASTDSYNPFES